jgi:antitoxin PrlF
MATVTRTAPAKGPAKRGKKKAAKRGGTPGLSVRGRASGGLALVSRVTSRAQTTLPSGVRKALHLEAGDKVAYTIQGDQAVIRKAATDEPEDPELGRFLHLLARDIAEGTGHVRAMPPTLRRRILSVTGGIAIDHDAAIDGAIEL